MHLFRSPVTMITLFTLTVILSRLYSRDREEEKDDKVYKYFSLLPWLFAHFTRIFGQYYTLSNGEKDAQMEMSRYLFGSSVGLTLTSLMLFW